jgi:predicted transcriptional regulator
MASKRILKYYNEPLCRPCTACAERSLVETNALAAIELPVKARSGAKSEIDQFNLGTSVVEMYTNGMTQAEIGTELNLTKDQVQHWLEKYREMTIDQKRSVHKRSIFDLAERLQETFEMVYNELIEQKGNPDLKNKNMSLLLKCIQVGGVFMEKLHQQQDDRRFKAAVLQVMEDLSPGLKAQIQRALSEMDLNQSIVRRL